ncbi:RNA polymerase sigma-70 factor (ECF subfamily) [Prauserella shujinwangii]|uniref:RNA polymerase sigma-70 factor (ECF subfamily) n=1 Tax=Prauserella shujinwangii TaxID=1453103 RepID=A0A2T0LU29_9PSEU|nr:RNA polymerase sigma factor ShbA [Prauserella shujinwangii]PRX47213.1 RNA polymerase sigma-70 factor (ECF subfamily) [Prauserella shujinwangii]
MHSVATPVTPPAPPSGRRADADTSANSPDRLTKSALDPVVRAAATGDRTAVRDLVALISPVVVRYCRARLGRRTLGYLSADDVAQETCVAVLRSLPVYQDRGGSFLYLVHAIAANKVADAFRLASRERTDPTAEVPESSTDGNEPERRALNVDLGHRLGGLLEQLPPAQRDIVILRVVAGLSAAEVGEALGISAGNVRTSQHRALSKLRTLIAGEDEF